VYARHRSPSQCTTSEIDPLSWGDTFAGLARPDRGAQAGGPPASQPEPDGPSRIRLSATATLLADDGGQVREELRRLERRVRRRRPPPLGSAAVRAAAVGRVGARRSTDGTHELTPGSRTDDRPVYRRDREAACPRRSCSSSCTRSASRTARLNGWVGLDQWLSAAPDQTFPCGATRRCGRCGRSSRR
jgi:hypothetical protein